MVQFKLAPPNWLHNGKPDTPVWPSFNCSAPPRFKPLSPIDSFVK